MFWAPNQNGSREGEYDASPQIALSPGVVCSLRKELGPSGYAE